MAYEYDFTIDNLDFRCAASAGTPYVRGTAPFRKEQFDAAANVGDQSLSGWWTRGQLSFHRGAGVKYYEVLEGEAVLNRFNHAAGLTVSDPGRAVLHNQWQDVASATTDIVCATASSTMAAWSTSTGAVKSVSGDGAVATHTVLSGQAVGPLAIAPQHIFAVTLNTTSGVADQIDKIKFGTGGTASEGPYFNHTAGVAILDVFYEKGRLWFVDAKGSWFVIAVEGGTWGEVFKAPGEDLTGTTPGGVWKFAATPGPVYLARDNVVFKVTVADDGSVPVLAAPVVVATLPAGDRVTGIHYYLGHLIIGSVSGVRAAVIGNDGSLTTGPMLFSWPSATAGMTGAALENTVYVYGERSGDTLPYVYAIDLSSQVSDLRYAYTRLAGGLPATAGRGGTLATEGWLYWWAEGSGMKVMRVPPSGDKTPQTLTTSGELVTGFHRFGTLDPKHFHSVLVRVGGTGGAVAVYRLDKDGAETLLDTINVPAETEQDIPLGLTAPMEMIGLRFVLTRGADPTTGPELLGYQIKALPAPSRQRILKWPLAIQDTERLRSGIERGRAGRAYTAITALENLETTKAVVPFTDHRTGETGSAYIDSVDFQGDTPPVRNSTGFGGIAYVTLRVLP